MGRLDAYHSPAIASGSSDNSQDALILNTLEITDAPEVARTAAEDLADSAERLTEVMEWIG